MRCNKLWNFSRFSLMNLGEGPTPGALAPSAPGSPRGAPFQPLTVSALPAEPGRPTVVVAHTVKGKGVTFMENELLWHYRPPDQDELARALAELDGG